MLFENQFLLILVMFCTGALVGFFYDVFRVIRKLIKTNLLFVLIQDIIFVILSGFLIVGVIFFANSGQLRGFEFIFIGLGILVYYLLFSRFIVEIMLFLGNLIKSVIIFLIKVIFTPIVFVFNLFKKPLIILIAINKNGLRKNKKRLKNLNFSLNYNLRKLLISIRHK